ncbi:polysaccharide pyruvyl transferase family protein [Plantactinospora sp. WMMB782]|uniref:polysaccharide pyruvyl transferase family protein n=1 Tax=Plantactinospora sp. WMMB782 TaxID=3404121 RepID=UPI003B95C884
MTEASERTAGEQTASAEKPGAEKPGAGTRPVSACLFGVPGAHLNLGVGALRAATVGGLLAREPDAAVTVFDDGWGQRAGHAFVAGRPVPIALAGARHSRRYHRPESYLNMRISAALGGLGNAGLARIDAADVVLDVSGGDSFSDIYGEHRFRTVTWPKRLTLLRRRPLVLLPQTYGPFRSPRLRAEAAALVRGARTAWARDPESYAALADLLGPDLDPGRHREGVDVAFALEPRVPDEPAYQRLAGWFAADPGPVAGVNVSGLIARPAGRNQFGLAGDTSRVANLLCERLLEQPDTRVIIVPHVLTPNGADDDRVASERLYATLAPRYRDRVALAPPGLDPHQSKWVIARTNWFCGMRMHSTIAALSAGVPAAVVAYSDKARGVFASVGQRRHVADARRLPDEALLDALWTSWTGRDAAAAELAVRTPEAVGRAAAQMDELVALARAERDRRTPAGVR